MKFLLTKILYLLARLTLSRYKPRVVAITGSVGKTSTKEAVATVLSSKFSVRATIENYNNEIGVPLTVIGEESGGRNPLLWLVIFIKALLKLFSTNYPQVLVLEIGTDRPGDIPYLVNLIGQINVSVLTDIGISHLEFFTNPQELAKEKLSLIKNLSKTATAVLNFDNNKIYQSRNVTKAQVVGFGFNQSDVMVSDFQIIDATGVLGANFKIHYQGNVVPFFLPNALGKPAAYASAAAVAVGLSFDINLVQASEALKSFSPPAGRLRLLKGIKHTQIIDDTYNAAPNSTIAALEVLKNLASSRKLAAIGDMAELGNKTEEGHREVAGKIIENQIDIVFLVGPKTKFIEDELKQRKFAGRMHWFENSQQAKSFVKNALIESDTILVKGSQSMRMEKIVREILADPNQINLLVRQTDKWLKKP